MQNFLKANQLAPPKPVMPLNVKTTLDKVNLMTTRINGWQLNDDQKFKINTEFEVQKLIDEARYGKKRQSLMSPVA